MICDLHSFLTTNRVDVYGFVFSCSVLYVPVAAVASLAKLVKYDFFQVFCVTPHYSLRLIN